MASFRLLGLFLISAAILPAQPVSFQRDIQPVLAERCTVCHRGAAAAPLSAIVAGKPESSPLFLAIRGDKPRMPKAGPPLTPAQVELVRRWIAEGAVKDSTGKPAEETWWSLRPLPTLTPGKSVDAFIREKLTASRLKPSLEADRRTLIRRLTFDLHGLPPTPAEVAAFEADTAAGAYERLVDRLLASPRYGERWARHWLDLVHYGDSHGYDKDKPRENAWPYRDYVIASFNSDLPYDRFIREQLAGDVLYPDDPRAFIATGFLAAGPWDFVGHQELKEGATDKNLTRVLDRDDMVAATVSTFTSATAHCARCHDHKFDPIPQQDYYNLQAVFSGVDRADRPFDDDPATNAARQALLREKLAAQRRLQPLLDKVEFATSPGIIALDDRIQDAGLLIAHIGSPKTPQETEQLKMLQARREQDRASRKTLVDAMVGPEIYAGIDQHKAEILAIDQRIATLPKPRLLYSGAGFFPRLGNFRPSLQPRPVYLLNRGSVQSPGKPAAPGALRCVPGLTSSFDLPPAHEEGERRAALANWIAAPANVLTWRSIVNRVWYYHFGEGLVDTPSDFGRMGSKPSHPELLDWLAVWFRDEAKGSVKQLHRLMVTSATYRQSSRSNAEGAAMDSNNRLLWRMNRMRLDAEAVRDSALSVAGKLDLTMGGPSVRMFAFKDDHSPIYDYARFDPDAPGAYRRSIYRFLVRSVPDPFMERLDCPDPSLLTPKRSTTLTAIQALALLNNPFMLRMSEHLAQRLQAEAATPADQIALATRLTLNREPTAEEAKLYGEHAAKHGLTNVCRLLLNTNEFLFVD